MKTNSREIIYNPHSSSIKIIITDSMTSPTTVAAILVLFDSTAFAAIVIPFPFEIIRMTGRAEGRVSGRGIHKRSGHDTAVARATL